MWHIAVWVGYAYYCSSSGVFPKPINKNSSLRQQLWFITPTMQPWEQNNTHTHTHKVAQLAATTFQNVNDTVETAQLILGTFFFKDVSFTVMHHLTYFLPLFSVIITNNILTYYIWRAPPPPPTVRKTKPKNREAAMLHWWCHLKRANLEISTSSLSVVAENNK